MLSSSPAALLVGTTTHPEKCDKKDLKAFFDKFLYMPNPDYPSRLMMWKHFSETRALFELPNFEFNNLARISENFSAGQEPYSPPPSFFLLPPPSSSFFIPLFFLLPPLLFARRIWRLYLITLTLLK